MKTEDLLNVDYTKEENKILIQKALKMIKPLSKYSDEVPQFSVECFIHQVYMKYKVSPGITYIDTQSNDKHDVWHYTIINTVTGEKCVIYSMCMYELVSKVAIRMWSDIKKGKYVRR